jgi:hypothetical protein
MINSENSLALQNCQSPAHKDNMQTMLSLRSGLRKISTPEKSAKSRGQGPKVNFPTKICFTQEMPKNTFSRAGGFISREKVFWSAALKRPAIRPQSRGLFPDKNLFHSKFHAEHEFQGLEPYFSTKYFLVGCPPRKSVECSPEGYFPTETFFTPNFMLNTNFRVWSLISRQNIFWSAARRESRSSAVPRAISRQKPFSLQISC